MPDGRDTTADAQRLRGVMLSPDTKISRALAQMDETGERILIVVGDADVLVGVVTDGDIRRWLLAGRTLDEPVERVMNPSPIVLAQGHDIDEARSLMVSKRVDCVPVVDPEGKVVGAIWWLDLFGAAPPKAQIAAPVVIMAGGEGTRLTPFTKVLPKPLVPVGEKPIVEIIMERFAEYGCNHFYLSLFYKANLVKAYFEDTVHPFEISWLQEERPLGTAGSLHLLNGEIDQPFFVTNCDILVEADFADVLKAHERNEDRITLVASVKHTTIPYGVCELDDRGGLGRMTEKPSFDHLVSTGLYVLDPDLIESIPSDRVYHMTDLINDRIAAGDRVGVYPVSEKSWLDMGQWEAYREMVGRLELS